MDLHLSPTDLIALDSNVLIFALDDRQPEKQLIARICILSCIKSNRLMLSPQAISETHQVIIRKFASKTPPLAKYFLSTLLNLVSAPIDAGTIRSAWQIEAKARLQWWDAMIVAHAYDNGCKYLLTEDMQDGFQCGDLMLCNPFNPDRIAFIDQL